MSYLGSHQKYILTVHLLHPTPPFSSTKNQSKHNCSWNPSSKVKLKVQPFVFYPKLLVLKHCQSTEGGHSSILRQPVGDIFVLTNKRPSLTSQASLTFAWNVALIHIGFPSSRNHDASINLQLNSIAGSDSFWEPGNYKRTTR